MVGAAALVLGVFFPSAPEGWELGELSLAREVEAASCPKGMVSIEGAFCIDKYEAATVLVDGPRRGKHKPKVKKAHSPYKPVKGEHVMAVSEKGKVPQAHISRDEAEQACVNAGKRLCTDDEWLKVCKGKKPTQYPYGDQRVDGACNDRGVSGFNLLFGPGNNTPPEPSAYNMENMNDPRLNQVEGSLAKAGAFPKCKNAYKVFDMVGNLHEWTAATEGTFRGGYYLDTAINGSGCDYRTTAHERTYHDYSTGFRCCAGGKEQDRIEKLFVKVAPAGKSEKGAKKPAEEKAGGAKLAKGKPSKGAKSKDKKDKAKSARSSSPSGRLASR
jgi:sulfatase modifying factor 1